MKILMLDKNYLVDRRIELVSQKLIEQGHTVKLVHTMLPVSFTDTSERRRRMPRMFKQMDSVRFSTTPNSTEANSNGVFNVPSHIFDVQNSYYRHIEPQNEKFEKLRDGLSRRIGNLLGTMLAILLKPQIGFIRLESMVLPSYLKKSLQCFTWLLSIFTQIFGKIAKPDTLKSTIKGYRELDVWETNAVKYAEQFKPDIVVANDMITLRAAAEIKIRNNCQMIYDGHELYSYQPGIPYKKRKSYYAEERKLCKFVDRFICCNEQHAEILERDFGIKDAVIYSNSTLQHPEFNIKKRYDWIRKEVYIPADDKIMIFQGGINKQRRIDYLLKGLADSKNTFVHIVFLTFGQEVVYFKQMAIDLGIENRVHFLDIVPWDEIVFWIASADSGIMPYQGTDQNTIISNPNKMYEFIAAGVPMIGSTELINVRKVVETEGFGVLEKFSEVSDYTRAIDRMFDPELGGSERFRDNLIKKHSPYLWDYQAMDVMKLYQDCIEAISQDDSEV